MNTPLLRVVVVSFRPRRRPARNRAPCLLIISAPATVAGSIGTNAPPASMMRLIVKSYLEGWPAMPLGWHRHRKLVRIHRCPNVLSSRHNTASMYIP
jgi:hypothetical protein